ncbi:hypothetical protein DSO57_1031098 [Entomophthora muscae]|uniref:Uncharacterized protein n=2 Tax=Entomophthora muscae TaxID=34485 RepID=A0ACC2ULE0_9FUNG|nr:hypothetical protein DSO57_1026803 [Entomophthora muscae]KAJ9087648.1 hypothetical protein DSO57_1031098 [Entomophthora muscae]
MTQLSVASCTSGEAASDAGVLPSLGRECSACGQKRTENSLLWSTRAIDSNSLSNLKSRRLHYREFFPFQLYRLVISFQMVTSIRSRSIYHPVFSEYDEES